MRKDQGSVEELKVLKAALAHKSGSLLHRLSSDKYSLIQKK